MDRNLAETGWIFIHFLFTGNCFLIKMIEKGLLIIAVLFVFYNKKINRYDKI